MTKAIVELATQLLLASKEEFKPDIIRLQRPRLCNKYLERKNVYV